MGNSDSLGTVVVTIYNSLTLDLSDSHLSHVILPLPKLSKSHPIIASGSKSMIS